MYRQRLLILASLFFVEAVLAATTSRDFKTWPNGVIPYIIEDTLPPAVRERVKKAIERLNRLGIVEFKEDTTDHSNPNSEFKPAMVFTYRRNICKSGYGYDEDTSTLVSIDENCSYGSVLHEVMHGLGMLHEQVNPLRSFPINFDRVNTAREDQYTDPQAVALTEHDPESIMHYGYNINSICYSSQDPKWTTLPAAKLPHPSCHKSNWPELNAANNRGVDCRKECAVFVDPTRGYIEGQREDLSELDIRGLHKLYARPAVDPSAPAH